MFLEILLRESFFDLAFFILESLIAAYVFRESDFLDSGFVIIVFLVILEDAVLGKFL